MNIKPKSYRQFFWKFGLFMPFETMLLAAWIVMTLYVDFSVIVMVLSTALVCWLVGLPASFFIAWLVSRFKWTKNHKHIVFTAITGFAVTLIYELIVMWVTDLITQQVGSFWHIEVLYLAWIAAVASYLSATLWLPPADVQAA